MKEVFIDSLVIMVKGMSGIFIVMMIIYLVIKILTYFGQANSQDK